VAVDEQQAARGGEQYVHGYSTSERQRLSSRKSDEVAGFFLPHLRSGMRLLDCGCGPGSVTLGLAEAVAPGEVVGIDVERRQIEAARALAADRFVSNVRFQVANTYDLPFSDASFDAVFANTVLIHLREPRRAVVEMRRVLRPGGVVGLADGDFSTWLWEPVSPALDKFRTLYIRTLQHVGGDPFLARQYRRLLLDCGFVRSEMRGRVSSESCGTAEGTRGTAQTVVHLLRTNIGGVAIQQNWITPSEVEAICAEALAWGERPDAFFAILDCAAVGWVADATEPRND
jgi:SAM-dependent methyltransferase